jgi:phosphoglycerol transferase MdoB-like AlkP superfamily enzyme
MNESFSDLSVLGEVPVSEDFLPFFRSLSENTVRGTAYASVFGGTTANSEYEFLTGNTTAFLPEGTVPFHLYVADGTPNLGAQMKALGYDTVFLHPYLASGWNRRAVYADFGFDTVLFQDDLTDTSLIREYISDQSDYESLIRLYEEKEKGQPLFLFNVTMQNHSGYDKPWHGLERTAELTGVLAGRFPTVDQYLSLIKQSDNAFRYLINYFSQVEEPTMILLFGDTSPGGRQLLYQDAGRQRGHLGCRHRPEAPGGALRHLGQLRHPGGRGGGAVPQLPVRSVGRDRQPAPDRLPAISE